MYLPIRLADGVVEKSLLRSTAFEYILSTWLCISVVLRPYKTQNHLHELKNHYMIFKFLKSMNYFQIPLVDHSTIVHIVHGSQEQYAINVCTYRLIVEFFEAMDKMTGPNPNTSKDNNSLVFWSNKDLWKYQKNNKKSLIKRI